MFQFTFPASVDSAVHLNFCFHNNRGPVIGSPVVSFHFTAGSRAFDIIYCQYPSVINIIKCTAKLRRGIELATSIYKVQYRSRVKLLIKL